MILIQSVKMSLMHQRKRIICGTGKEKRTQKKAYKGDVLK